MAPTPRMTGSRKAQLSTYYVFVRISSYSIPILMTSLDRSRARRSPRRVRPTTTPAPPAGKVPRSRQPVGVAKLPPSGKSQAYELRDRRSAEDHRRRILMLADDEPLSEPPKAPKASTPKRPAETKTPASPQSPGPSDSSAPPPCLRPRK
ncbi:hypothetical protein PI124_g20792 [Phytophthora idaei]|nr:hypothetical protein PI125_g22262 [Phytophthora idaei]KAG3128193.1 hypothetical protein PI126_g21504 [Phytophthora idaei]KAG3234152.1 hypothetical protein PI124_g20792 [Phytophthora idaei]